MELKGAEKSAPFFVVEEINTDRPMINTDKKFLIDLISNV